MGGTSEVAALQSRRSMIFEYVDRTTTNALADPDIANRCGTTTITVIGVDFAVVPLYIHFKGIHEGNVKVAF